jgi:glutaredoxin|tara:strand:- start:18 stop:263 length:246 start_codon:yes stop_codon:yes gene_type:complete
MDKHYTIYITKDCPFCAQARDELFRQGVNHTIFAMDDYPEELQAIKDFYGHPTVPVAFLNMAGMQKLVGGYTELKEHFDKK